MADGASRRVKPRLWRLQFSLTSVFVLMTLSAVGMWVWFERPYVVELKGGPPLNHREVEYVRNRWGGQAVRHGPRRVYDGQGKLLSVENYLNGMPHGEIILYKQPEGTKLRLTTYVRGQKDGPSRQWNTRGELIAEENYRRGLLHGRFDARYDDGKSAAEGSYEMGRPLGKWWWFPKGGTIIGQWRDGLPDGRWEWKDGESQVYLSVDFDRGRVVNSDGAATAPDFNQLLSRIAADKPAALWRFFAVVDLNFARFGPFVTPDIDIGKMPLKDLVENVKQTARVPLMIDARSLEESSISPDLQITCDVQNTPLVIALGKVLKPYGLGCDYRYGTLWIDTTESIAKWKDRTGVTQLVPPRGSRLAGEWNKTSNFEFIETPLKDVVLYLRDVHGGAVQFDLSRLPQQSSGSRASIVLPDIPITLQARGIEFKHSLAMLLNSIGCKASLKGETIVVEEQ